MLAEVCVGGACAPPQVWLVGGGAGGAAVVAGAVTWAWLSWLRWLPAMGGFTRLRQDRLLDHPVRADLHARVAEHPGIHHQGLVEAAGLGNGQASHHLSVLVRGGLLTSVRRRGFLVYFVRGALDAPVMHGLSAVRSPTAADALRLIGQRPGEGARPLARQIGCSESTLRHHVRRLAEAGLVAQDDGLRLLPLGEQVMPYVADYGRPRRPPGD